MPHLLLNKRHYQRIGRYPLRCQEELLWFMMAPLSTMTMPYKGADASLESEDAKAYHLEHGHP